MIGLLHLFYCQVAHFSNTKYFIRKFHCAAIAYALLLDLAINFFRSVLSSKWQENSAWLNSQTLKSLHNTASQAINHLAVFHDKYLSAKDPFLTLKVELIDSARFKLTHNLNVCIIIVICASKYACSRGLSTAPQLNMTFSPIPRTSHYVQVTAFLWSLTYLGYALRCATGSSCALPCAWNGEESSTVYISEMRGRGLLHNQPNEIDLRPDTVILARKL